MAEYWNKLKSLWPSTKNASSRKRPPPSGSSSPPPFKDLGTIVQAPLDFKRYKVIQLHNGLKICLVSTCKHKTSNPPQTDHAPSPPPTQSLHQNKVPRLVSCCKSSPAAICVTVGAGSFHDPPKTHGMAHFVEHLIFLGSKQYPESNKLVMPVFEDGGMVNATTKSENTSFYFACNTLSIFEDCVSMLVDGLTNPLFSKPAMLREIEIIDSEFALYQTHDFTRTIDFLLSLAQKGHPFSKFNCGNKKTLNKPDILAQVRQWKEHYYCADNMTVCIQAPMSIKKLESFAVNHFSDMPSRTAGKSPPQELLDHGAPFSKEDFEAAYYILPLNLLTALTVSWTLPAKFWKSYKEKPMEYIRLLLECTSKGGLKHYLRKKNWIHSWNNVFVVVNFEERQNVFCTMFTLNILPTDKGYENKKDVLQAVFSYLKLLSKEGVTPDLFAEMQRITANKFQYTSWQEMLERGKDITESMQNIEQVADILTSMTLMINYNPKLIKEALDGLTPRSANYIFVSRKNLGFCKDRALPNRIQYSKEKISPKWYKLWEETNIFPDFALPPQDTFIPKEMSLLRPGIVVPLNQTGVLYQDKKLFVERTSEKTSPYLSPTVPNCSIDILLRSPTVTGSTSTSRLKTAVLEYWCRLVMERITEQTGHDYDHLFNCDLGLTNDGIEIHVEGPSLHAFELVALVVQEFFGNCGLEDEGELEAAENLRTDLIRQYVNGTYDVQMLSLDLLYHLQQEDYPSFFEMKEAVTDMSVAGGDFLRHVQRFRKRMLVDVFINGSMTTGDAHSIVSLLTTKVDYKASTIMPSISSRRTMLPVGTTLLPIAARHPAYVTSVITNFYQVNGWDDDDKGYAQEFVITSYFVLNRRIFNQLRTKEQLGYFVHLDIQFNPLGINVTVLTQPEKHETYEVDARIDYFLRQFYNKYLGPNRVGKLFRTNEILNAFRIFYEANLLKEGKNFRKLSIQIQGYHPGKRISSKAQEQVTAEGEEGAERRDSGEDKSLIALDYLDLVEEEKKKMKREKIRLIGSIGQFKKEMGYLGVNSQY